MKTDTLRFDAAAKHGISVIVGTPTYAIPAWLFQKYPDILAITSDGPGIYGRRQNMDITHPGYRAHAERIIRVLMEHIKNVPHIIGFQLDNETKSYDTAGPRVQQMFVDYLKEKYPDIREFNHEFGLDYWSNRIDNWDDFPDVIVREYARPNQFITQNFDFDWTGHSYGFHTRDNCAFRHTATLQTAQTV